MTLSPLLDSLITALQILPGVGPKSAQRMALHILERNRDGGLRLSESIQAVLTHVGHCRVCRAYCEEPVCGLCLDDRRDERLLCVVEGPADLLAIEQAGGFRGRYFVLHGHLSPLDGIGPSALGLDKLAVRLKDTRIQEVILATNPTVEGEATAHYLAQMVQEIDREREATAIQPQSDSDELLANVATPTKLVVSRIAHGVPMGGELELIDSGTLSHALVDRKPIPI